MFLGSSRGENWWRNGVIAGHPGSSSSLTVKDLHRGSWHHVQRQYGGVGGLDGRLWSQICLCHAVPDRGQTTWLLCFRVPGWPLCLSP